MASKSDKKKNSQKHPPTPAPPRRSRRLNEANLYAAHNDDLIIVGIGASAGGLQALKAFFESLPAATGMAYVVITHLHPEHESHLAELLQRSTSMTVQQVNGPVPAERDHVYVIPPNRCLVMQDSQIDTAEFREPRGQRAPIDYFFRSLARGHPNAVGIILSGGGTDGAVGVRAIKEEGGVLMVQDPHEAEYESMPNAAIATGLADLVLPVADLARKLLELSRFTPPLPSDPEELGESELEAIRRILAHVHARTGHDFSQYKRSTLLRRIRRRMQIYGLASLDLYLDTLRQNPGEAIVLFNDILIGVTSFFRDRESWDRLAAQVIPEVLKGLESTDTVRLWTIGCSTGEEAYGLAMLFLEAFDHLEAPPRLEIFASDLDENSIKRAREGIYPTAIEADFNPERLERFFTLEDQHYRVRREVRDVVLFTHHNVLRDAPFSRLDLITCRNLLIYLEREIQNTVFDIFHYALKPGGYLFLGSSESIETKHELFQVVDKTHRLFRTKPWTRGVPHLPSLPSVAGRSVDAELYSKPHTSRLHSALELPRLADVHAGALEELAPPTALINENLSVLHLSQTAGRFLLQPSGPITTDIIRLVRPELQLELRAALVRAFERDQAVLTQPVLVQFNGHPHRVILSIQPRTAESGKGTRKEKQALVFFLEDQQDGTAPAPEPAKPTRNALVHQLKSEVRRLREQLQASVEEYESSSEELKASNEELQSVNEEYRSATEELETSKEELQSINEELQTVNNELKSKLDEISRSHTDLENLMSATEIATLFLDRDLRIRHFTPGMRELFNIMPPDRGRPIGHLTHTLQYSQFLEDAEAVLRTLVAVEREVRGEAGRWFLLRLRPYRTLDDHIEGVILTFVDITQIKRAEEQLRELNATLENRVLERTRDLDAVNQQLAQTRDLFYELFDTNPVPTVLVRQEDLTFLYANIEFLNYFSLQASEVIGRNAREFGLALNAKLQEDLKAQLREKGQVRDVEFQLEHPAGESRTILASFQTLTLDHAGALIVSFIDITERVRAERDVRALASALTGTEQAERHRLSQILHDDLQQRIFAVQMHLSFLKEAYEKGDLQSFQVDFSQLEAWLAEAIKVTRQLSVDLSPPILHGEGLLETVIWLAAHMNERYGLKVDIQASGASGELDENVRILTFYTIREVLFNIVKHAGTLDASIRFEEQGSRLWVVVQDQGKGFESAGVLTNPTMAHGLLDIRHRLNLLGCDLQVASQPGQGTRVLIEIPYRGPDGQAP